MEKIKVVITDLSFRPNYYQWFIYGLMLLDKRGDIRLKFELPLNQRLYVVNNLKPTIFFLRAYKRLKRMAFGSVEKPSKSYFRGYVIDSEGRHTFCIDSADSPDMFSGALLRSVDVYFKMQCPKEFDERGFKIGNDFIPFFDSEFENVADEGKQKGKRRLCQEVYEYQSKIKPLMVGPRSMGRSCSFKEMDASYRNLLSARAVEQTKKVMCYFGSALGPVPSVGVAEPDWDWESDIMGYFGDRMNHPNEKRAKIAAILESLGEGYDARVINGGNSDSKDSSNRRTDLIVPLKDFSGFVAAFQYNINISGYRMSIPARFIDSFVCGTAIATDNLHVRWYHPFGDEVTEIGEMGYLPDSEVDYDEVSRKLKNLNPVSKDYVIAQYERYWAPAKVAEYIVESVCSNTLVG